jgi:hypothetical protein
MSKKQIKIEKEAAWYATQKHGEMPSSQIDGKINPAYGNWWDIFYAYFYGASREYKGKVPEDFRNYFPD